MTVERHRATHRPVFVYGTLRPSSSNWSQLAPFATGTTSATLPGFRLYVLEYPCAVGASEGDDGAAVRGDVVWLDEQRHDDALASLDWFEGFRADDPDGSLYIRTTCTVTLDGSNDRVEAWVYLAGPPMRHRLRPDHEIAGGDWLG